MPEARSVVKSPTDALALQVARVAGAMIHTRNLVCHILPRSRGQKWRATVEHLRRRMALFNGKRIIAVATDTDCDSAEDVKAAFGEHAASIEWLTFQNDPGLREVISFVPMLERVASLDPNEATFICHGKGSTHGHDDSVCHLWRDMMFETCGAWPLVECALGDHAVCGAFRMFGAMAVDWHFSGTFYWIRHDKAFSRDWRRIRREWAGTEVWPGDQFLREESTCLFLDDVRNSLYDENFWEVTVLPALQIWKDRLRACGLSMTAYSPPTWFLQRHPNFLSQTGPAGSATTAPAKRSWLRIPTSLKRVFSFSKK